MNLTSRRSRTIIWAGAVIFAAISLNCRNQNNPEVISASGTIEAVEVNVASKTAGQVDRLLVEEGARVQSGDILAAIDSTSLEIQRPNLLTNLFTNLLTSDKFFYHLTCLIISILDGW